MEDKAGYIHRTFSSIAGHYDLCNAVFSFNQVRRWRRSAVSRTGLKPGELALDVATGTGGLAREIGRRSRASVVGVDFCLPMLERARNGPARSGAALVIGDAQRLPFPENTFDGVAMAFVLRNVSDIPRTLREAARVVKAGRRVVCLEFSYYPSNRMVRGLYHLYLRVLPLLGRLLSGDKEAYGYLSRSIQGFASPGEVRQAMEQAGLEEVQVYPLTLGVTTLHVGTKPGVGAADN